MIKIITLGVPARQFVIDLLGRSRKGDIGMARIVRELRKSLRLRELDRRIQEWVRDRQTAQLPNLQWDDLFEIDTQVKDEPEFKEREFTIEDSALTELQKWILEADWSLQKADDGMETHVPVSPAILEAMADLESAINKAMA